MDRRVFIFTASCALALTASAARPEGGDAKRGQARFAQSCGFCHGPDANGGAEGPNLMRSAIVRHDESGNLIGQVIREGRPTRGMPPIPLTESEISDVVAFVHARLTESDLRSPDRPSDFDLKLLLTGNAGEGKAFFYGLGGCSHCHSPSGDLAGIAAKYPPADLQARFLYPADVAKTVTVTGRPGTRMTGELIYQDQFTIALKDKSGWYHSWPTSQVSIAIDDPLLGHLNLLPKYRESDIHNLFAYLETLK